MASILKLRGKYRAQVRMQGRSLCRTFSALGDARRWAREQEVAIERGGGTGGSRREHGELPTLVTLLDRYAAEVTPSKKGAAQEAVRLGVLRRTLGTTRLDALRPAILTFTQRRLQEVTSGTVLRDLALLRSVVAVARRDWGIPVEWPDVSMPAPSKPRTRRPSQGELDALLAAAHTKLRPAILLLLETGMRRGELLSAQWVDVDWEDHTLRLRDTKNGESRLVPLSSRALKVLATLPRDQARIIPVSANALRLAWERLKAKLGLHDLRMHDLRREAASRAFEKGLSLPEVALLTGHRTPGTLLRHYAALEAKRVARRL